MNIDMLNKNVETNKNSDTTETGKNITSQELFDKMKEVENTANQNMENVSQQVNDNLNTANEQVENTVNNINNGMNKFIDSLESQEKFNQQFSSEKNITPDKLKLEPGLAALVSFLVTGLGQAVNGQVYKGLAILGVAIVAGLLTCGIGGIVINILNIIDSYNCASLLKSGQALGEWEIHIKK